MSNKMEAEMKQVSDLFRENLGKILKGMLKVSLSTRFINSFCETYDTDGLENASMTSSFQMTSSTNKVELTRDIQVISDIFQRTLTLKLLSELKNDAYIVDISRFKSLTFLELHRVKVNCIAGIQKLRSQIQKLICTYSISSLSEILEKCGLDNTNGYSWNELKEASFIHNGLTQLGDSLEYSLWLHTLDLSCNLLNDVSQINILCNLKHLNLSYNRFEKAPCFSGLICNRLRTLVLKNNFIEEIDALSSLVNIYELDLSHNSLLEHKSLAALSNLASLQALNLEGNPLSFHPQHRNITCSYLHKNTATVAFILDREILKKSEKSLVGMLHPVLQRPQLMVSNSFNSDSVNLSTDRQKRIRNVTIQEDDTPTATPTRSPDIFTSHLETKRQIEYLRQHFGSSWLKEDSALQVQDVLGLEKSGTFLSSTPRSDIDMCTSDQFSPPGDGRNSTAATDIAFITASEEPVLSGKEDNIATSSDDDDDLNAGKESMYYCKIGNEIKETLLVVTTTHISERDCITSRQKARWHINMVISCDIINEEGTKVQLNFDTVRRNRQRRIYTLDVSEAKRLVDALREKMDIHKVETKVTMYQCMKCSLTFSRKNVSFLVSVSCPSCESNLIIECMND